MRDLYKTIQMCAEEDAMDYCPEFDEIKAILENCDQHVKPFKKLRFRSGNESIINELTRQFLELFEERVLIDLTTKEPLPGSQQKLRKIFVFLLANTDATYKYNLRDDPNMVHVVEICPLMPKFLTIALAWDLQLNKFLYEALSYTPCWFAFQYFEAANESLKYIEDVHQVLNMLEELLKALLINICLSDNFQIDDVDQKIIFNKLYDQAIILLRRFNTPDANKIDKLPKRRKDSYWGYTIKYLLQMVVHAFDLYEDKLNMEPNFDIAIYKIGKDFLKIRKRKLERSLAVKNQLSKIINSLLSTLQNNVMAVTMTTFIEWAEIDLTPEQTLQQIVGEMAYNVRERINANVIFEHGVEPILKSIEIQPKPLEELVNEANIGKILRILDSSEKMSYEVNKIWFDALFKKGITVFGSTECVETINEHLNLITLDNCIQVIDCLHLMKSFKMETEKSDDLGDNDNENTDSEDDSDNENEIVTLLFGIAKQLQKDDLIELIKYEQKIFGELSDGVTNKSKNFNQRVTIFFNKSTTVFDFREFLLLCFEHPLQMWTKFFTLASNTKEYTSNFYDTVFQTISFSFPYVDKILKDAIHSPKHSPYISELICELYFILYKEDKKSDFLARFINGHINSRLDAEDYESLLPLIKALYLISSHDETLNFDELTAPMLAMVAIVADLSRWNINTYSDVRVELVDLCLNFILQTLRRFLPVASEKDRKWLSTKTKAACIPLTQFYFQKLVHPIGEEPLPLDQFLCPYLNKADKATVLKFLEKNLMRCTNFEFKMLTNSENCKLYISDAICILANNVRSNLLPNAIHNFRSCFAKYLNFVNDTLKPKCKTSLDFYTNLNTVLDLISNVPNEIYSQVFMEAESLLKDLLKNINNETHKTELENLQKFVITMSDCPAKDIFLQHFKAFIESNLV